MERRKKNRQTYKYPEVPDCLNLQEHDRFRINGERNFYTVECVRDGWYIGIRRMRDKWLFAFVSIESREETRDLMGHMSHRIERVINYNPSAWVRVHLATNDLIGSMLADMDASRVITSEDCVNLIEVERKGR